MRILIMGFIALALLGPLSACGKKGSLEPPQQEESEKNS
jgi:predicted small lipoprotein YifL